MANFVAFMRPVPYNVEHFAINGELERGISTPDDDHTNPLPVWTPTEGGCEGMQPISGENKKQVNDNNNETVPVREAYRPLHEYAVSDRGFPKGTERPFVSDEGSE